MLRMPILISFLLLFLQLPGIFASLIQVQPKVCGAVYLAYSKSFEHELFYLDGNLVDRVQFCKALLHCADGSAFEGYVGGYSCELNPLLAELPLKAVRKLLEGEAGRGEGIKHDGQNDNQSSSTGKKMGIVATGFAAMCCAVICPCLYRKRKPTAHTVLSKDPIDSTSSFEMNTATEKIPPASPLRVPPSPSRFSMSPKLSRIGSIHLSMSQVARATQNFSLARRIGEGGFGTVYKAQLDTGQVVAIKRAKKELFENLRSEFSSEVELLAKIEHRNLVKLLGYIDKGKERLIITEYVPNGTLREHLDGQHGKILDFNQRLEIAIDIAHGLTYLHLYAEKQIIHRDVKSSNILLTESMRAKVADFGFARLGPVDSEHTHISTKVKGTVGYLDPEYMRTYQLTPKSDVYSFGVLLIEILTGRRPVEVRRPVEERVTLRWAFESYNEGRIMDMVDPSMEEAIDMEVLVKMLDLAFQCAAPVRDDRPDMKSVGEQLWSIRADYLKSKRG